MSVAATSSVSAPPPVPVVRLALWFALVFGLAEGAWMTWSRLVIGNYTMTGIHVLWLASIADLFWYALIALVLLAVARIGSAQLSLTTVLRVYLGFGLFTLTLLAGGLHPAAGLMLATGLAWEAGRQLGRRGSLVTRTSRLTTIPLLAMLAIAAGTAYGREHWKERRALAAVADAHSQAGAPNVLLLILDTVRDLDVSASGYARPTTPTLERVAREGVRFSRAWSPSSWTLSSHASMFTGRLPHELSAGVARALDAREETVAERLARHGWLTAGFVGNVHYGNSDFGLDRGFQHYEDYIVSPQEVIVNSSLGRYLVTRRALRELVGYYDILARRRAPDINRNVLRWLDGAQQRRRPFFAFVNYYDAHEPYEPPDDFERRFASPTTLHRFATDQSVRGARRLDKQKMTPAEIARLRDNYDASIAYLDAAIGSLLDSLRQRGLLDNTLVIITSDHGEQFGEHGLFVHGNSLYQPVMKIPLIMSMPGRIPTGTVVDTRVNARSIAATITELTGTVDDRPMPGRSVAKYLVPNPPVDPDRPVFFEVATPAHEVIRSMIWRDLQYVRVEGVREELIALPKDSTLDRNPLARGKVSANKALIRAMAQRMDSILAASGPERWAK